ncbi:MAG: NAD(P)-dependent oxidoreductase [Vicinamibacterales bacterium]
MREPVGFIGLGIMGRPMAANLLAAGHPLVVHNRSRAAVDALVALGARPAANPAEVARQVTRVFTMLPDSPDVEDVLEGDAGLFSALLPETILIDTSTIAPAAARRLAARAASLGAAMLDAPVSGGDIGAISGTLSVMVGGDKAAFQLARPLLEVVGDPERVVYLGPAGSGQLCKVCNQLVIGGTLAAVSEAFALATRAGVDPAKVRQALLGGFAASRVLDVHGGRIIAGDHAPGFKADLYAKDLRIARDSLSAHRSPAPVSAVVHQLVERLVASGRGGLDYSALAQVVFELDEDGR